MRLKICVISEICVRTPHLKNLCTSVKSVGHIPLSGGICTDRIGRFRVNP